MLIITYMFPTCMFPFHLSFTLGKDVPKDFIFNAAGYIHPFFPEVSNNFLLLLFIQKQKAEDKGRGIIH